MRPLHLAFAWHLHQPYYKDDLAGTYLLPWVRLRSTKDYHKMAALLDSYPRVRQTFNLVPSLLAQIEDYSRETGAGPDQDLFWSLSRKPATDLTAEERAFVLRWMRESPRFLRVQASPRYCELAGRAETDAFTTGEIRDLQVWYNLAGATRPGSTATPPLGAEVPRPRLHGRRTRRRSSRPSSGCCGASSPTTRSWPRAARRADVLPLLPPILPLVANLESAREAQPDVQLPERPFAHRDDALRQIEAGRAESERLTGVRPRGMWPSELAVGEDVASIAVEAGVDWFISDEAVLGRSLGVYLGRDGRAGCISRTCCTSPGASSATAAP